MGTKFRLPGNQSVDYETEFELARQETLDELLKILKGNVKVTSELGSPKIRVPGIGTGAAYTIGDAFGTEFFIPTPLNCTINNVIFIDYDDEGLRKDLWLFTTRPTPTADNAAFAPSDPDLGSCIGVVSVDLFYNAANTQLGIATPALSFKAPNGGIWCQIQTQGADNIAAGATPEVIVVVE